MFIKTRRSLLLMCSFIMLLWMVGISPANSAQVITVTYRLDNVQLLPDITHPWEPSQQMTGSFEWTYEKGDFENGSGHFTDLFIPWYNPGLNSLEINIDLTSIEIVLPGNFHDLGIDITLFLLEPLSLDQSVAIDTTRSKFEIQNGVIHMGSVESGNIVLATPIPDIVANGSDSTIILNQGDNLNVTISLDPISYLGVNSDWWIFMFNYDQSTGSLIPLVNNSFQSPLFNLPPTTLIDTAGLPAGTYLFFFGVDTVPNSIINRNQLYSDMVSVIIL